MKQKIILVLILVSILVTGIMLQKNQTTKEDTQGKKQNNGIISDNRSTVISTQTKTSIGIIAKNYQYQDAKGNKNPVIRIKKDEETIIALKSTEGTHNLVVEELKIATKTIQEGETTSIEIIPTKAGTYTYYCSIGTHREQGMQGTIIIEE